MQALSQLDDTMSRMSRPRRTASARLAPWLTTPTCWIRRDKYDLSQLHFTIQTLDFSFEMTARLFWFLVGAGTAVWWMKQPRSQHRAIPHEKPTEQGQNWARSPESECQRRLRWAWHPPSSSGETPPPSLWADDVRIQQVSRQAGEAVSPFIHPSWFLPKCPFPDV